MCAIKIFNINWWVGDGFVFILFIYGHIYFFQSQKHMVACFSNIVADLEVRSERVACELMHDLLHMTQELNMQVLY